MKSGRAYCVVTTADGAAACDVYSRQENTIDVVITDRDMPGINGGQWIHAHRRVSPNARNVMVSGTVDRWTEPKDSLMAVSVLEEPFTPAQLLQTLKNRLAQQQAMSGR